nr:hypothetical protein CFP56_64024 [Quercus suber]
MLAKYLDRIPRSPAAGLARYTRTLTTFRSSTPEDLHISLGDFERALVNVLSLTGQRICLGWQSVLDTRIRDPDRKPAITPSSTPSSQRTSTPTTPLHLAPTSTVGADENMSTTSPPLTPIRRYMSPLETSPGTTSYREEYRRRTSSFSSNHGSPVTPRSNKYHRFSNGSQLSTDFISPMDDEGHAREASNGMGNLADELDQLDDDEDYTTYEEEESGPPRDSGIDVNYDASERNKSGKSLNGTFASEKPPDVGEDDLEMTSDLEDLMSTIARMASASTPETEDPLIPRVVTLLQDLGNQTGLEAGAQRLTTATNSQASYLLAQSKMLQNFSASLISPFAFSAPLDLEATQAAIPLVEQLLKDLPFPDPAAVQGIRGLDHANEVVIKKLSELTDTLQMGKHDTNNAARHLRTTQTMMAELRRERERAELARQELRERKIEDQLKARSCAAECKDVVSGFEEFCDSLRQRLAAEDGSTATVTA